MAARQVRVGDPMGERVAALEAIVPEFKEDITEFKADVKSLHEKMDKLIDKVNQDLGGKASKSQVEAIEIRLRGAELKQAAWAGGGSLLGMLIGWFGKYLIDGGGGK